MKDLTQGFGDQTPATDDGVSRHQHGGADALSTGGSLLGGTSRKEAIAAVGVAGNFTMIVLALTQMLGVGTTTLISQAAGRKRPISSRTRLQPILRHVINCSSRVGHL